MVVVNEPVSEAQIEAWADEAEQGYELPRLRKRGRRPVEDGSVQYENPRTADIYVNGSKLEMSILAEGDELLEAFCNVCQFLILNLKDEKYISEDLEVKFVKSDSK